MPPIVDIDDLLDAGAVADLLGLASRAVISSYRRQYPDFPAPILDSPSGRAPWWHRPDIVAWQATHRRTPGPAPRPR